MTYALDPSTQKSLQIKLFKNVKNVPELREKLLGGDLNCVIIKPNLVIDPFQIIVAANKAASAEKLTTKSLYTEILFNLSISKNITQSLQRFGIHDNDINILVATFDSGDVFQEIQGDAGDLSELENLCDKSDVQKAYKLSGFEVKNSLLESVVSKIACKDVI